MHLLHSPEDPLLDESLRYIVQFALESSKTNYRIDVNTITLSCTMNTLASQAITYAKPFKSAPFLLTSINPSINSSVATKSEVNRTATGFTAQVYTSSTQNVDFTYLAIGPV